MNAFKYQFPVAIGVALLALSASAMAGGSEHNASQRVGDPYVNQREVSYRDLDLTRAADASKLYSRIERVARDVCRTTSGPSAKAVVLESECASKAVEDAVLNVDNTNLTAVHTARVAERSMVASSRAESPAR